MLLTLLLLLTFLLLTLTLLMLFKDVAVFFITLLMLFKAVAFNVPAVVNISVVDVDFADVI